jgi:hypothetical protein
MLDGLDEIVRLHDGSVSLDLDDVLIDELAVRNGLARDYIDDIDLALIVLMSFVIEEDVLGAVVSLVHEEDLAAVLVKPRGNPGSSVIIDAH